MWPLALVLLAALAVAVDCRCSDLVEPLNKTVSRLEMNDSLSWNEVESTCDLQNLGQFEMLGRDFLLLADEDKALCGGHSVPLRLRQEGGKSVVWPANEYLYRYEEEVVNSTYLSRMLADENQTLTPTGYGVGSLDLSTGLWRLVDNTTTFVCAICQRAWIGSVSALNDETVPETPRPFVNAFNFYVETTGPDSCSVDEAIRGAEKLLSEHLMEQEKEQVHLQIKRVDSDHDGHNKTLLRLKTSTYVESDDVLEALNGSFTVKSWQHVYSCPSAQIEGIFWESQYSGGVQVVSLGDFHVAVRRCSWRSHTDGDWYAVWDEEVSIWYDHSDECLTREVSNLLRRLQEFAERTDVRGRNIKSLLEITGSASELELPSSSVQIPITAWNDARVNVSRAVLDALSSLMVPSVTGDSASSACQGSACALFDADLQGVEETDVLVISSKETAPKFENSNEFRASNQFLMYLQLPRALTERGPIAMHALLGSPYGSLFSLTELAYSRKAMLTHVVSSSRFEKSEPEKSRAAVIFRVNNTGVPAIYRQRTVWSLGESTESNLLCPWVRSEGTVDTFLCNKWSGGSRNVTTGTFLAIGRHWPSNGSSQFDCFENILAEKVFLGYTTIFIDKYALSNIVTFANTYASCVIDDLKYFSMLNTDIFTTMGEILSGVILSEPIFTASLDYVKVLVSNMTVSDPVVGFSLHRIDGAGALKSVTSVARNVPPESEVDLVLGAGVQDHCQQLAILAICKVASIYPSGSLGMYIKRKLMVVYLVVTLRSAAKESSKNVNFDIQLFGESEGKGNINEDDNVRQGIQNQSSSSVVKSKLRFRVVTWSEDERDWHVSSCIKLRSTRASKSVVRCDRLAFTGNQHRGKYLIFEPVAFAEAFGTTSLAVLIVAGILSCASVASIAATAAALPAWRKDLGHKILLQMTLALSFNLALGFASSLVYVDTASVACVAVGALRHFSYLAMFAWMLVMSGLQLRRMVAVFGTRNTPKLLLKVSLFAWGVPTIAVVSLLFFNVDMYLSDAADHGFCYPEGVAFRWAVQAPAATVLALNTLIFVVIFASLFDCRGWGKTEGLRRHMNGRTFQMRRLRAVFFTFSLFGITWVFHLLAEQGVFQNKYLYEYLFLITASVHVFSLSCIFVFFDRVARAEWAKVVASRWRTWTDALRIR